MGRPFSRQTTEDELVRKRLINLLAATVVAVAMPSMAAESPITVSVTVAATHGPLPRTGVDSLLYISIAAAALVLASILFLTLMRRERGYRS
jgi:LPXTG-motif cell wall-anchored protein